jgi:hypothetical protein
MTGKLTSQYGKIATLGSRSPHCESRHSRSRLGNVKSVLCGEEARAERPAPRIVRVLSGPVQLRVSCQLAAFWFFDGPCGSSEDFQNVSRWAVILWRVTSFDRLSAVRYTCAKQVRGLDKGAWSFWDAR